MEEEKSAPVTKSSKMRCAWFEHVRKTRVKLSKGKETCTHREAMKAASTTWAVQKEKLVRKHKREARKNAKSK